MEKFGLRSRQFISGNLVFLVMSFKQFEELKFAFVHL